MTLICFSCADGALQRLYDEAVAKCERNLRCFGSDLVLVEGGGYEKLWLETQPMGGEMYAGYSPEAAMNNTLLFMRHQRADGRLPGSIQLVDGHAEPQFNKLQGFCFPYPALNLYYLAGKPDGWLPMLAQCLERFDAWLWRTRDSDQDGCLESYCVYDTGEDNAVRYGDAPRWWESDEPPANSRVVPMASMDVMSYSYACRDTLRQISRLTRDGREAHWARQAQHVADRLRARLWDEEKGACFDRDKAGQTIPVLTHNNLRCMYWGSFSQDMADRFVKEHLLNPREFWTALPLPSVSVSAPAFRNIPENNWSGQCEGLTYQRAIRALENYGYFPLVTRLGKKLFEAVTGGGYVFTQQFDPFTGAPSVVEEDTVRERPDGSSRIQDAYGPTLLAVLAYIAHIWGVHIQLGEVWFSLGSGLSYEYQREWQGHRYRIGSDGSEASIWIDDRPALRYPCGRRVVTDEQGNLLRTEIIE
ncbi:MAG: hypothetical protein J1E43_05990 [Christensenellaceae bacterium]|nr:hypothetical protein [Christensenellaceae bacterium]